MQALGHFSGREKGTSWCRKADWGRVKAEMAHVAKKAADGKRKSDAAAATSSTVGSTAALVAAKRPLPRIFTWP